MSKHTATPWRISPNSNSNIIGSDNTFIGKTDFHMSYDEANAAHIVRCVNAHADLVKALEAMTDRWEPDCIGTDRIMWENALAALEKAKAGA